jgi:hypothetical protein
MDGWPTSRYTGPGARVARAPVTALLAALLFAAALAAEAQPTKEVPRIGVLQSGVSGPRGTSSPAAGFREGLRELGYAEGRTSPSSTGSRRESSIGCLTWPPSWSDSGWTSS